MGHQEGSALCTAVKVLSDSTSLGIEASKRVLWAMVREWEDVYDDLNLRLENTGIGYEARLYAQGLRCQMSGNEQWSRTTLRYSQIE